MIVAKLVAAVLFTFLTQCAEASTPYFKEKPCEVKVQIESGWVCGLRRRAENGLEYASFQGIPYARQPLGERRFKELEPVKPWDHLLDATQEGPICPQHDEIYSRLMAPQRGMSEACIYGNVYVPTTTLPNPVEYENSPSEYEKRYVKTGRKILVFIHGGAFQSGSADSDLHGPEYLVGEGIIVITFNYRLNVFGFLSLNTPQIPGNAGMRDMVTFLRWVQRNARYFGGDPDDVTLMGISSGSVNAHILSLSKAAEGLFRRVILLSGTANPGFYTASPINAIILATLFLTQLGMNSTDPDLIHDQLLDIPLERIMKANSEVQYMTGFISFAPVVETPLHGITRILDDEPLELVKKGRGKEYPLMIQFATNECEFFRNRLEYYEFAKRIEANPTLLLSPRLVFNTLPQVSLALANKTMHRYFKGKPTLDEYMYNCLDVLFRYPSFKLAQLRSAMKGAPVYLSEFSYESEVSVVKKALHLHYNGAAHVEDLTFFFKPNGYLGDYQRPLEDDMMKEWMNKFVINFMKCSKPTCTPDGVSPWPAVYSPVLNYQRIHTPGLYSNSGLTNEQADMLRFFDEIEAKARKAPLVEGTPEASAFINSTLAGMRSFQRPAYVLYRYNKHTETWEGYKYEN